MALPKKVNRKRSDLKHKRLLTEKSLYKRQKWARVRNHAYLFIFFPIFLPIHLLLMLFSVFSKQGSFLPIYYYLKWFFSFYFFFIGIRPLFTFPPPSVKPHKPTLFFTTRNADLISFFLSTLFSYPVSAPFQSKLRNFPIHFFFPFIRMGSFVHTLGYPDQPLHESLPDIHHSLEHGVPTIVFLNPKFITPLFNETLPMYNDILELMDTSIDCYFLACKGIETYKTGSLLHPTLVSINCVSSDDLFDGVDNTHFPELEKYLRIMKFFDYQKIDLV